MRKSSNRRWPSCPRDPSRRLHPLPPSTRPVPEQHLEGKTVEPDSTEDVVGSGQRIIQAEKRLESTAKDLEESYVDKSIEAVKEGSEKSEDDELESTAKDLEESNVDKSIDDAHESSEESEEEENGDSTDEEQLFADTDSDSGTGIMPPQIKFLSPKVFKATPEDDAFDWLERYESTGAYNQWGDTELRANFSMYLDGAARKWYLCSTLPTEWRDLPIRPGVGLNAADLPAVTGVRTLSLKEFQQQNYKLFQETRLRNRVQGIEEATTNYYYDVIDLCRVVDPTMAEATKVDYLFWGLRPSLVEKLYPLQPKTGEEFLEAAKRFTDAKLLANRRNWPDAVLGVAATRVADVPIDFIRTLPKPAPTVADTELWKVIKELQGAVESLKIQATPPPQRPGNEKTVTWGESERIYRNNNGVLKCYCCNGTGHMARNCWENPQSARFRQRSYSGPPGPQRGPLGPPAPINIVSQLAETTADSSSQEEIKEQPILRLDFSKLIREEVTCGTRQVMAVVDTGAALTVISPELLRASQFVLRPWDGPRVVMANGEQATLMGAATISVNHKMGTATGEAVVFGMDGIDLILGNDFLKQYGKVQIDYREPKASITFGDQPLAAITSQRTDHQTRSVKLITNADVTIPSFSVANVMTVAPALEAENFCFEPSGKLLQTKGVSVGHALLAAKVDFTPLANLTSTSVWIPKGTTLGVISGYDGEVLSCGLTTKEENSPMTRPPTKEEVNQRRRLIDDLKKQVNHGIPKDKRRCNISEHNIETGDSPPIHQAPYASAWKARTIVNEQVKSLEEAGIIEISDSSWSAPVVLIRKKDGTWRFCVDYRKLNSVTVRDVYPLPRIADVLSRLEGAEFFSILDLQAGYHQIPVRDEDRHKTAFITADGLYQFKVLPFGLSNGPSSFQRSMDIILAGLRWTACLVYLDDVIVYSSTIDLHVERLRLVLESLKKAGLKLKVSKCHFAETSLKVLGHVVDADGIRPDPDKLAAVKEFPPCNEGKTVALKVKKVQSYLGLCSYYRPHIKDFSIIARPLILLTKKDAVFDWGPDQESSFNTLKQALLAAPVLAHPNYDLPMEIIPDACGYGIGAVLAQRVEGQEHPLAYASRLLSSSEINYSITEKECLALVWALKKFKGYVWGCKIVVVTDHQALCWLLTKRDLAGRLLVGACRYRSMTSKSGIEAENSMTTQIASRDALYP
ncbi:uncharacterized protein LOC123475563 [Daphnia magna]|uniref:uncharacterized protein LOC123475563 n=1 Tax=Daphnia magna TaxID=35525 RepID=UPI001E1BD633|nr:uncharacterized protein LOC123475563 [Daphnia magna]